MVGYFRDQLRWRLSSFTDHVIAVNIMAQNLTDQGLS